MVAMEADTICHNLSPVEQMVVEVKPVHLEPTDYMTLRMDLQSTRPDEGWLNDRVVDFALQEIFNTLPATIASTITLMNSMFFTRLTTSPEEGTDAWEEEQQFDGAARLHQRVAKWTKHRKLKKFVVIPVIHHGHWYTVIVAGVDCDPIVLVLDSLLPKDITNPREFTTLIISAYIRVELGLETNPPVVFPNMPRQSNGSDCALFAISFVKSFMRSPCSFVHRALGDKLGHITSAGEVERLRSSICSHVQEQAVRQGYVARDATWPAMGFLVPKVTRPTTMPTILPTTVLTTMPTTITHLVHTTTTTPDRCPHLAACLPLCRLWCRGWRAPGDPPQSRYA